MVRSLSLRFHSSASPPPSRFRCPSFASGLSIRFMVRGFLICPSLLNVVLSIVLTKPLPCEGDRWRVSVLSAPTQFCKVDLRLFRQVLTPYLLGAYSGSYSPFWVLTPRCGDLAPKFYPVLSSPWQLDL